MNINKKYAVYGVVGILSLSVIGYMSAVVVPQTFVTLTKAAPASKVSVAGSYLLADKILALANGSDEASVNVYVLDKDGKPVANKNVVITGATNVVPTVGRSDDNGKVNFKLTSNVEGQQVLTAEVEGIPLPRTVTVTFRN